MALAHHHSTPGASASAPLVRVAVDTTAMIGRRSGIGQLVAGMVGELERRTDVDVRRVAFTWSGRHEAGAHHRPIPARAAHFIWAHTDLAPVEWWSGPVDVVHGTNYVVPPARRAARLVSVHDLTAIRFPQMATAATLRFPSMVQRAFRSGASVHCDSEFVAQEVREWLGATADRVHVVHPGVPRTAVPSGSRVDEVSPPYILSLATAEPRKDLPGLVLAFADLASSHGDLRLVLAGQPGWGSAALDSCINALPPQLRSRIDRPGWVDDEERGRLFAGCALFAYPSLYEGFGFPPLEAMSTGVPVVATRAGSLPEVLGDACPLVTVGDRAALAGAMDRMLIDGVYRRASVAAGLKQVERFSWPRMGDEMTSLYRALACR